MSFHWVLGYALALLLIGTATRAQPAYPPQPVPSATPASAPAALYSAAQLDQMLATIALYPDPLLSEILTAATYPYELDEAARWRAAPANAALSDGPLAAALAGIDWDPSVKSLVAFPQILQMMDEHLDWTQALGNAFLAQQSDVMDSIQRLRHDALAAGTLVSGPYQTVTVDGPYIEIEPFERQSVFIPVYNPATVYGPWPYPAYPPVYYGPPPGLGVSVFAGGIGFSIAIGIVDALWHWSDWDWRDHDIRVDRDRFNRINAGRPPTAATTWQHNPDHRRGVPYPDARSREAFGPKVPGSPEQRQQYRFYGAPQQQAKAPPAPTGAGQRAIPGQPPQGQRTQPSLQARPAPTLQPRQQVRPPSQEQGRAPLQSIPQPPPSVPQPHRPAAPSVPAQTTTPARPPVPATPQRPATAFQRLAPGAQAQAEAMRGQQSRQSAPTSTPNLRPAPPAVRPAQQAPQRPAQTQQGSPQRGEHRQ